MLTLQFGTKATPFFPRNCILVYCTFFLIPSIPSHQPLALPCSPHREEVALEVEVGVVAAVLPEVDSETVVVEAGKMGWS